jgi:hypothetical protein
MAASICSLTSQVRRGSDLDVRLLNQRNIMKKKIGVSVVITLLTAAVLHLAGAPLAAEVRTVHGSGQATLIDSSWQIQWYAFALAGLFVAGIVLAALPSREKRNS